MKWVAMLLVLWLALATGETPAHADDGNGCDFCAVTGGGASGTLDVTFTHGQSDRVPGRPGPDNVFHEGVTTWDTIEESAVPTCSSNVGDDGAEMCVQALTACPADDQVQFWIWHRVTHHELGKPDVVDSWHREPNSYCLGPDDPGPDNGITRAFAFVQTEFARLPLPRVTPRIEPAPRALVNVPTVFSAGSADPVHFTRSFGRFTFDITATPQTWTWHYGEGEPDAHDGPGTPGDADDTSHTYVRTGIYRDVYVAVTWGGTFTISGSDVVYPIRGTAMVSSARTTLDVRQARTELVS